MRINVCVCSKQVDIYTRYVFKMSRWLWKCKGGVNNGMAKKLINIFKGMFGTLFFTSWFFLSHKFWFYMWQSNTICVCLIYGFGSLSTHLQPKTSHNSQFALEWKPLNIYKHYKQYELYWFPGFPHQLQAGSSSSGGGTAWDWVRDTAVAGASGVVPASSVHILPFV